MKTKSYIIAVGTFLLALLMLQATVQAQSAAETEELLEYQHEITESYLKKHLTVFSHDSLEGRETGMPGQKKAAQYLSEQFQKLGLKPVGDNNTYFQKFDLNTTVNDSVVFETYKINGNGRKVINRSVASRDKSANYIRAFGGSDTLDAEIIFIGYGIQNESLGINHLKGVDLKGKWVMGFGGELPQVVNGDTLYKDRQQFAQAFLRKLFQKGVAGILTIADTTEQEFREWAKTNRQSFGEPAGMRLAYRDQQQNGNSFSYNRISAATAADILELNSSEELNNLEKNIRQNLKEFSPKNTGFGLKQTPYSHKETIVTENVLGLIEGGDPELKDEVVVLSAHYDHVGIGQPDSTGDRIYNGANDDGSGTIGTLAAAKALAKARDNGKRPKRSVLFLMVSGEEKGLLGSRYYSDHPVISIEKTVANINTDMIGRVDPEHEQSGNDEYVYIIGSEIISSEMDSLLVAANKKSGNLELDKKYNDLNDPNQFYRRSDHWNFGRFGVPFVFFFNGVHEDYHRPSDEIDKMQFDLLEQTVRTMYATTVMVANAEKAPEVDNQEFIEITKGN